MSACEVNMAGDNQDSTHICPGCFAQPATDGPCPTCGFDRTEPRPANALPLGTLLDDQFLVGRVLGTPGGFGITYLGFDAKLATRVAIKEYLPRDIATRGKDGLGVVPHTIAEADHCRFGLTRFLEEARTLARLDHPNILRVRHFFEANGSAYMVADYLEGMTLAEYLDRQPDRRLPEDKALALLRPIFDGLRAIHAKNLLHRDIKPANIYLARTDAGTVRPTLLDFGAARHALGEETRALSVVLTEHYAPFEQYHRKGKQGPWTDVYAAAATLYRMVTGSTPPTAPARLADDELTSPAAFGCSPRISAAIVAGLTLDAEARPRNIDALLALLEPDPVPAAPPTGGTREPPMPDSASPGPQGPPSRRHSLVLGLAVLAALLAGSTLTLLALRHLEQNDAHPAAATADPDSGGSSPPSARAAAAIDAPAPQALAGAQPAAQAAPPTEPRTLLPQTPAHIPANPEAEPPGVGHAEPMAGDTYIVRPNGEDFTSVRRRASKDTDEVRRLYPGQRVTCDAVVRGQILGYGNSWLHCPEVGGYVYATLLVPELNGSAARRLVARKTNDNFVAVRAGPWTSSAKVAELRRGQAVQCNDLVRGQGFKYGDYWLHCPDAGGYVYAPLLIPD
jgi:serine/threonine protein kinase